MVELLALFILVMAVMLIADYLVSQAHLRRIRRKRLEARIDEIKREGRQRREGQTLNTRGRAP